jgi:hypothetical protein
MDMFEGLRDYAANNGVSLNEAVRTFVTWGMESADKMKAYEEAEERRLPAEL